MMVVMTKSIKNGLMVNNDHYLYDNPPPYCGAFFFNELHDIQK